MGHHKGLCRMIVAKNAGQLVQKLRTKAAPWVFQHNLPKAGHSQICAALVFRLLGYEVTIFELE